MKQRGECLLRLLCAALLLQGGAASAGGEFHFGVIANALNDKADEAALRQTIDQSDRANLAFVVVNGIKSGEEPCSEPFYNRRKSLLDSAQNGLIVSLAASDWSDCKSASGSGKSIATERLNRVREMFFADEFSLGASKLPLTRLSSTTKFRSYAENARWEFDDVLFATVNLSANNNRFHFEAGRNNEFEDRQVANRYWLHRIFAFAQRRHYRGIVLFSDGNPLAVSNVKRDEKRDGFAEVRQQITYLSSSFSGQVLLISRQVQAKQAGANGKPTKNGITWKGNVGHLGVTSGWLELVVKPAGKHSAASLFSIRDATH
jgi:hypothetical protein